MPYTKSRDMLEARESIGIREGIGIVSCSMKKKTYVRSAGQTTTRHCFISFLRVSLGAGRQRIHHQHHENRPLLATSSSRPAVYQLLYQSTWHFQLQQSTTSQQSARYYFIFCFLIASSTIATVVVENQVVDDDTSSSHCTEKIMRKARFSYSLVILNKIHDVILNKLLTHTRLQTVKKKTRSPAYRYYELPLVRLPGTSQLKQRYLLPIVYSSQR